MAKQAGIHLLRGSLGDLIYCKTAHGYLVKEKSGPDRRIVLNSDRFVRTRENAADFKTAISAATLLRRAVYPFLKSIANVRLNGRMNGVLLKIIRSDAEHIRGARTATAGALHKLTGFEFNNNETLAATLRVLCTAILNPANGNMQVSFGSFIPQKHIKAPAEATHFRIVSVGASIDFTNQKFINTLEKTPLLAIDKKTVDAVCMQHQPAAMPGQCLLLAAGIAFYKMVDGFEQMVKGGAMRIVEVREVEK